MFDWFSSETDAIAMSKKDHDKVKVLFDRFKTASSRPAKAGAKMQP